MKQKMNLKRLWEYVLLERMNKRRRLSIQMLQPLIKINIILKKQLQISLQLLKIIWIKTFLACLKIILISLRSSITMILKLYNIKNRLLSKFNFTLKILRLKQIWLISCKIIKNLINLNKSFLIFNLRKKVYQHKM